MKPKRFQVRLASAKDLCHVRAISKAIAREVKRGAIGMARRPAKALKEKILSGHAVIAKHGGRWAGFCYISPWEGGESVSTSALIVKQAHRGQGLARRLKEKALRLSRERYPKARPFGLSTSEAVLKINLELGFVEVPYSKLPRDLEFWKGCESCPFHAVLKAHRGKRCHCHAMLKTIP